MRSSDGVALARAPAPAGRQAAEMPRRTFGALAGRPAEARPGGRCVELDGLRGLAALMVVLSHYVLAFQPALLGGGAGVAHFPSSVAIGRTPLIALYNPELGVAIFFVLSGFVLAASVDGRRAGVVELVARRWLRLSLPIFATSALVWLAVEADLFRSVAAAPLAKSDWLAGNYAWIGVAANDPVRMAWQSFADLFLRGRAFYNAALWTMPAELWGSVVIFAAYCWVGRSVTAPAARLAIALLVLALVWRTPYFGFPCGVALFEVRRLWAGSALRLRPAAAAMIAPCGAALLVVGVVLGGHPYSLDLVAGGLYARLFLLLGPVIDNPVLLMHRLGAVTLVAAALMLPCWRAVLRSRVCRHLGRVSFMVYLCHVPLLCSLGAGSLLWLAPRIGYNAATLAILPAFLGTLMLVAEATTRAFDGPAIRLSHAAGMRLASVIRRMCYMFPAVLRTNREIL